MSLAVHVLFSDVVLNARDRFNRSLWNSIRIAPAWRGWSPSSFQLRIVAQSILIFTFLWSTLSVPWSLIGMVCAFPLIWAISRLP